MTGWNMYIFIGNIWLGVYWNGRNIGRDVFRAIEPYFECILPLNKIQIYPDISINDGTTTTLPSEIANYKIGQFDASAMSFLY